MRSKFSFLFVGVQFDVPKCEFTLKISSLKGWLYFRHVCDGHKNNFRLQFCSSFKTAAVKFSKCCSKQQKLVVIIFQKFILLIVTALRPNGLIDTYKLFEARRNVTICFYIYARKTISFKRTNAYGGNIFVGKKVLELKNAELNNGGSLLQDQICQTP